MKAVKQSDMFDRCETACFRIIFELIYVSDGGFELGKNITHEKILGIILPSPSPYNNCLERPVYTIDSF